MRIAVLSDAHANREALVAVQRRLRELEVDTVLCLGDMVGYNADPDFCVTRILDMASAVVRGNHDKTVASPDNLEWFNEVAREAILWTRGALSAANLRRLQELPAGPLPALDRFLLCHGSPMDEDLYITRQRDVEQSFAFMERNHPDLRVCFFGHTHVPLIVQEGEEAEEPPEELRLEAKGRYLINPGSVGQPRDRDPRASFGVVELQEEDGMVYRHYRVPYPVEATQAKIRAAGLPSILADRLTRGW
jgi:diadenosine tetraphosphatase ApaH/serine/threonine PP2A family protein phosphatase